MYKTKINYKLLNLLILMGLLYIIVTNIGTWYSILSQVFTVCLPFIIAFGISYALYPLVKKLEAKGLSKSFAVSVVVLTITAIILIILIITLPLLYNQLITFASSFGQVVEDISNKYNVNLDFLTTKSGNYLETIITSIGTVVKKGKFDVVGKTTSILGKTVITYVVAIYFLSYMDRIRTNIGHFLNKTNQKIYNYLKDLDIELTNYLKGLALFMVIQFFEYSIVFFIAGHPNWLLFGILACVTTVIQFFEYSFIFFIIGHPNWFLFGTLACLTTVIPYFGGLITNLLALITASVISPSLFIATLVVCMIFPQVDGYIISPKVYGKTNNINPLITIMMVSIGGTVGGVFGIIIALPVYILISSSYHFFKGDIKKGVNKVKRELK